MISQLMVLDNLRHNSSTTIPPYMEQGVLDWVNHAVMPGHFLCAILRNDFYDAVHSADASNLMCMRGWGWVLEIIPRGCWGSTERIHGWEGLEVLLGLKPTEESK